MRHAATFSAVLLLIFFATCVAAGAIYNAPCPRACGSTPGGNTFIPLDDQEAEYTCCNSAGACTKCDACPWYLELWC